MAHKQFSYTNSKGVTYYLNVKAVTLRGGEKKDIYYFSKEKYSNTAVEELPEGMKILENPRNGFLSVVREDAPAQPAPPYDPADDEEED